MFLETACPSSCKIDQSLVLLVLRSATLPMSMIDEVAQQTIAQRISMLSGVAQVDVFGSQKYAVRVDVDPRELAARSIGIDEVAASIASANSNLPTGTIYGQKTFVVQTNGQLTRAAVMRQVSSALRSSVISRRSPRTESSIAVMLSFRASSCHSSIRTENRKTDFCGCTTSTT